MGDEIEVRDGDFERLLAEKDKLEREIEAEFGKEGLTGDLEILEGELEEIEGKFADEDIDLSPPPPIDPARLEAIPEVKSLEEGGELLLALDRNIQLVEGREALARRARQLELLKLANGAKRCSHLKVDGRGCGSPAIRGQDFCYYHDQLRLEDVDFRLIVEDRGSLHIVLQRLVREILRGVVSESKAKLLIQIYREIAKDIVNRGEVA